MLIVGCTSETPEVSNETIKAYHLPTFNDVRKTISTKDGATAYVGMDQGIPAVLVLNEDFSLRFFTRFTDFGPGCFQNVCEMSNGDIAMVGYTQAKNLGASSFYPQPLMIQIDQNGSFTDSMIYRGPYKHQFTSIFPLENEGMLMAMSNGAFVQLMELQFGSLTVFPYNLGPTSTEIYVSAIGRSYFGNYFHVGNQNLSPNSVDDMAIYSKSSLDGVLQVDESTHRTYDKYTRPGWNNDPIGKPLRGEIFNSTSNEYACWYGTSDYSNDLYSILLLNMNFKGGINEELHFYGEGQAVFQNMVSFSKGYLLLGSTIKENQSFSAGNYDTYVVAVDFDGNLLWEDSILTNEKAETAMTAIENNGLIKVCGYSKDQKDRSSFIQITYELDGKIKKE